MVWAALLFVGRLPVVIEGGRHCGGRNTSNAISGGGRGGGNGGGDGLPCIVRVVHQSGTIRKSQEKIIELARRDIVRFGMTGAGGVSLNDALDGIVGMANDGDESEEIGEGDDDDEDEDME